MDVSSKASIPAGRASPESAPLLCKLVRGRLDVAEVLNAIPCAAAVLDSQRQILLVNSAFAFLAGLGEKMLVGKIPGEVWGCVHCKTKRSGCGETTSCRTCGVTLAIRDCENETPSFHECRFDRGNGEGAEGRVDLRICARPLRVDEQQFTVLSVEDISARENSYALGRIFFHDILNTATGLQGFASLLAETQNASPEIRSMAQWISFSIGQLADTVNAQRMLCSAEVNTLRVSPQRVSLRYLLSQIVQSYTAHDMARGRSIRVLPEGDLPWLESDPNVLSRVLLNLLKTAVEDSQKGETITLSALSECECVHIRVHSPAIVIDEVKAQYFCRYVARGSVRELDTYTVLLLTEKYLGGRISFESAAPGGTTFTVTLPLKWWKSSESANVMKTSKPE